MMHWSVATVADVLGREVIIPACFPRFVIPVTSGKTALQLYRESPMPSESKEYYISYHKPDQLQRRLNKPGKPWIRCFVGELTDEQVVKFKKISDIDNIDDFYLQKVDDLDISSTKAKPAHRKTIERFSEGIHDLADCSDKYCKMTGDSTGEIKQFIDFCECCKHIHDGKCDYKCDWYKNCIHPIFRRLFPTSYYFDPSAIRAPESEHPDDNARRHFIRSFRVGRHIVVIFELALLADKIRSDFPSSTSPNPTVSKSSKSRSAKPSSKEAVDEQREIIKNKVNAWHAKPKEPLSEDDKDTLGWLLDSLNKHRGKGWDIMAKMKLNVPKVKKSKEARNLGQKMRKRCKTLLEKIIGGE